MPAASQSSAMNANATMNGHATMNGSADSTAKAQAQLIELTLELKNAKLATYHGDTLIGVSGFPLDTKLEHNRL